MRFRYFLFYVVFSFSFVLPAMAGNLDSPGLPSAGSGMYTLQGLYDYLLNGVAPAMSGSFLEPTAGPGSTGKTTKEIYDGIKGMFDAADATPDKVLSGSTFFSTDPNNWGPKAGTLATQTPTDATTSQPAGFYNAFDLSAVDTDLGTGNIRSGVSIFGISGDLNVVDTSLGDATSLDIVNGKIAWVDGIQITGAGMVDLSSPAPVEKTGQITSYAPGDDGDLQKGVVWPVSRFEDNLNGTVTDNLTGLIWLQDGNCLDAAGGIDKSAGLPTGALTWTNALTWCNNLASGLCGLTDGSAPGDWRLTNRKELDSLLDLQNFNPSLPSGHPFVNVLSSIYWSSTTSAYNTGNAWNVNFYNGYGYSRNKSDSRYVLAVRGGQ